MKSVKSYYQKGQIIQYAGIGFPVRVRVDSKTEILIRYQKHENSQLKYKHWKEIETKQSKNLGHGSGYVSQERGATLGLDAPSTVEFTIWFRLKFSDSRSNSLSVTISMLSSCSLVKF